MAATSSAVPGSTEHAASAELDVAQCPMSLVYVGSNTVASDAVGGSASFAGIGEGREAGGWR